MRSGRPKSEAGEIIMRLPQPIPYQGSKRNISGCILSYFPDSVATLTEAFAGSAAVSIAAARFSKANRFLINDSNEPLMRLWRMIIERPEQISSQYEMIWQNRTSDSMKYYNRIRTQFNTDRTPDKLLYLLARCVKSAVRYNSKGEFNQSPDKRRLGKNPVTMRSEITEISALLKGKTEITSADYTEVFEKADSEQLLYLDPPYQGVCMTRDTRYYDRIDHKTFIVELSKLNEKEVPFILSYDGRTESKRYGGELPENLKLKRIEINAGRSSQATLLGKSLITYESIYLSPALISRLDRHQLEGRRPLLLPTQTSIA
jgi:DNA adenine methylase